MSSPSKIAKILVQAVSSTGELETRKVACESFWKDSRCVIIFFRRFGWQFCRLAAQELSETVKPILDKNNVRFIGIGFDTRFVQPFVEGGFFKGELYVDTDKSCYTALQYQSFSWFDLIKSLLTRKWRETASKATSKGIGGDMKGDGFQNGGALIVDKNGKQLYEYRQDDASEQISADQILKALNLTKE